MYPKTSERIAQFGSPVKLFKEFQLRKVLITHLQFILTFMKFKKNFDFNQKPSDSALTFSLRVRTGNEKTSETKASVANLGKSEN